MKVTVVGDVLLDVDVRGTAERLSPDGAAPVVDVETRTQRAGGAGLVASMLLADGYDTQLITALSGDDAAGTIRASLAGAKLVAATSAAPTPVKTRLRVGDRSIARIDEACGPPPRPAVTTRMLRAVRDAEVIIVADYGRGLTERPELRAALESKAREVPLVWDPHPNGAPPVPGTALATPNASEAVRLAGGSGSDLTGIAAAAATLCARWGCPVAVTMAEEGALIVEWPGATPSIVPTQPLSMVDPCGAGDRFSSAVATCLAAGATITASVQAGVDEAGRYLAAGGVAALGTMRTPWSWEHAPSAAELAESVHRRRGTVVATAGHFELVHAGHARALSAARSLGDCLIVCIDSDAAIRRGGTLPLLGEDERAELLLALESVDAVAVFDDADETASLLRPDVWVVSEPGDDTLAPGLIESWSGQTVVVASDRHAETPGARPAVDEPLVRQSGER